MAVDRKEWADSLTADYGGWLSGFLAEERGFDRRAQWRLGMWGVAAVGSVIVAILASHSSSQLHREQNASADLLARQSEQIQSVSRQTQTEAKRLSAAIETLNNDRDRLYSRVTSVEQGLDSVTGSIKRQASAPAPPQQLAAPSAPVQAAPPVAAAPVISPVLTAAAAEPAPARPPADPVIKEAAVVASPAPPVEPHQARPSPSLVAPSLSAPLMPPKSMMAPPDPAAMKLTELPAPTPVKETLAAVAPVTASDSDDLPAIPVQRTEFGVDLGSANTIDGLRGLWRGLVASNKALGNLRPIIVIKERGKGYGTQLRLVAGPLGDAAAAAKLCAAMGSGVRNCETSVYDGQQLALKPESAPVETTATIPAAAPARPATPAPRRRATPKPEQRSEVPAPKPVEEPAPPPKPQPSLSSFLGIR